MGLARAARRGALNTVTVPCSSPVGYIKSKAQKGSVYDEGMVEVKASQKITFMVMLLALGAGVGIGNADDQSQTMGVSATVRANCKLTAQDLSFGEYMPGAGNVDSESAVTVRCSKDTEYAVSLDNGTGSGASPERRLLSNGDETLQYQLYTDAARTTLWDANSDDGRVSGEGRGMAPANEEQVKVFGRLPDNADNQDTSTGAYSDVITVTITF